MTVPFTSESVDQPTRTANEVPTSELASRPARSSPARKACALASGMTANRLDFSTLSSLASLNVHPELAEVIRSAIDNIDKAHNVALAAVEAAPDPATGFAAVKELTAHLQALTASDDELQTQLAARIWDAEKLSLASLADRVGMSQMRADQQAKNPKADEDRRA